MLMLERIKFDNQHISISNIYVTSDLEFLVILLGKEFDSPKWCFKYKLHSKAQLEYRNKIGQEWTINTLRLIPESNSTSSTRLGIKESPIQEFVKVDKYVCLNLGNNVLYNLLDYRNQYIEILQQKKMLFVIH